ncbi:MAG: DoxX family protein [Bdellovibrionales bacterium]
MIQGIDRKNSEIGYLVLRLTMGFNMFAHGLVRLPKLDQFSGWMLGLFENSWIPLFLVKPFSYSLPFIELIVGVLLILGIKTSIGIHTGALIISSLVLGSCLIEKWDMAGGQMLYAIFFFLLAIFLPLNKYSLDTLINRSE